MKRSLPWFFGLALLMQFGFACSDGGETSDGGDAGSSAAGSGGTGLAGAGGEPGEIDQELSSAVAGEAEEFQALDDDVARLEVLNELDARVERELWRLGGIDEELGEEASADEAYAASTAGLASYYAVLLDTDFSLEADSRPDQAQRQNVIPDIGGALFGGVLINKLVPGVLISETNGDQAGTKGATETMTVTGSREQVSVTFDFSHEEKGVTTKLSGTTELVVCPDATGAVAGQVTLDMSATAGGGDAGEKGTLTIDYVAQTDDDAELVGMDLVARIQLARFRDRKGEFVDLSVHSGTGVRAREFQIQANRGGGELTDAFVADVAKLGTFFSIVLASSLADEVSKGWKSGRCVEVQTTPAAQSAVEPGASVRIEARPRSRIDGAATGGNVTGTLAGETSLDPQGSKVPADATFTYVAPGETGQSATVSLEARSKRGVGLASLSFSTGTGYVATGGGSMIAITGEVASLTEPFTLTGTFSGGMAVFDYTPADATSGSFVSALSGSGVTGSTEGTYTISGEPGGPLTLEQTGYGCIDGVPNSCRTATEIITLTPKS